LIKIKLDFNKVKKVAVILSFLILASSIAYSLQPSWNQDMSYLINMFSGYNQTRSGNDQIINNGGFYIRFINGTNNPIILKNSTNPSFGINVTISDTTGGAGGLTQAYTQIQDEGTNQTQRFILNFVGSNISCTDQVGFNRTTCTITGSPLTGSGTNGQVTFWTSSTTLSGDNPLFWNSTTDKLRVGVSTSQPRSTIDIFGSLSTSTLRIIANTTLDDTDFTIFCDNTSNITINLPDITQIDGNTGRIYIIKKISNNTSTCTIDPFSTQIIEQSSTLILDTLNESVIIQTTQGLVPNRWKIIASEENPVLIRFLAHWNKEKVKTNIGTSYADVYSLASEAGNAVRMDLTGKTSVRLDVTWDKIGSGTQAIQLIECTPSGAACTSTSNILIDDTDLVDGYNLNTVSIPSALLNSIAYFKLQVKSTTAADDPVFQQAVVSAT